MAERGFVVFVSLPIPVYFWCSFPLGSFQLLQPEVSCATVRLWTYRQLGGTESFPCQPMTCCNNDFRQGNVFSNFHFQDWISSFPLWSASRIYPYSAYCLCVRWMFVYGISSFIIRSVSVNIATFSFSVGCHVCSLAVKWVLQPFRKHYFRLLRWGSFLSKPYIAFKFFKRSIS